MSACSPGRASAVLLRAARALAVFCVFVFVWGLAAAQGVQPLPSLSARVIDQTGTLDAANLAALAKRNDWCIGTGFPGTPYILFKDAANGKSNQQNLGTINTTSSHEQIGMFSIAALLIGGASVTKASIPNVIVGVILFHLLFLVSPMAGKNLIGSGMLGEYFRQFVSYGVIALALVLYEWKRVTQENDSRATLRGQAPALKDAKGGAA